MTELAAVLACSGGMALGIYAMRFICRSCVENQATRLRNHLEAASRRGGEDETRTLLLPISARHSH
jgi:hypothetical protein